MQTIELTLVSGAAVTFFVDHIKNIAAGGHSTTINDGTHNNGGWKVQETYADVMALIAQN